MEQQPDWFKLEVLVAEIQASLAPDAEVVQNAKLQGFHSETTRQIDVLVTQRVGQYTINIVMDCKDYKTPVDVKGVEEFYGLFQDVRAHRGVLVCPAGFSATAKRRAKALDIALYQPIHTGDHKWKAKVTIPAICEVRTCRMAFGIETSAPYPFMIQEHPAQLDVFTDTAIAVPNPLQTAMDAWNNGQLPDELGVHKHVPLYSFPTMVDNGYGLLIPMTLTIDLHVERERFFGDLPVTEVSGFQDAQTGHLITNAFHTGALSWDVVRGAWKHLKGDEEPPRTPGLEIRAYQYLETLHG